MAFLPRVFFRSRRRGEGSAHKARGGHAWREDDIGHVAGKQDEEQRKRNEEKKAQNGTTEIQLREMRSFWALQVRKKVFPGGTGSLTPIGEAGGELFQLAPSGPRTVGLDGRCGLKER